ncbi:hypothetical protein VKT23_010499 [Stygiomarasmius scandens]|uniref:Uncharacterized protein n=1 Tax=Marasmiellus scandens TaxID=2682957 RepID=A0ABR1JBU6_9AGAR
MHLFSAFKNKENEDQRLDLSHAKGILFAVASVSKAAGFPPLEGAAQIATKIIEIAEATKNNKEDCVNIAHNIVDIFEGIKDIIEQKNLTIDDGLRRNIEKLKGDLQGIQRKLESISKQKMSQRIFRATSDAEIISECKEKIKTFIELFNIKSHVNNWQTGAEILQRQDKLLQEQLAMQKSLAAISIHNQQGITYE